MIVARGRNLLSALALGALCCHGPLAAQAQAEPGDGVLCLGTMIYFMHDVASRCDAASDAATRQRLADYARRFDAYIIRNGDGAVQTLERFKEGQGIGVRSTDWLCSGDTWTLYENFRRADAAELDRAVDDLLARDGPPRGGDCV